MMKRRTREHKTVNKRHGDAHLCAVAQSLQHPARPRAMHIEHFACARVARRDDERLPFKDETDVTDEALVQNFDDRLAFLMPALRQTPDRAPLSRGETLHQPMRSSNQLIAPAPHIRTARGCTRGCGLLTSASVMQSTSRAILPT